MGDYQYHAVPGNLDRLRIFGQRLRRLWRLVLSRRSEGGMLPWNRLTPIFTDGFLSRVFCILIQWKEIGFATHPLFAVNYDVV